MAYDRYDKDNERSRRQDDDRGLMRDRSERGRSDYSRHQGRADYGDQDRDSREDRGFFERAGDEIASWFGDDDAERRQREDQMREQREGRSSRDRDRDWTGTRGINDRRGFSERDYNPSWRRELSGSGDRDRYRETGRGYGGGRDLGYRPMTGDYGRGDHESEQFFAASGVGRGERGFGDYDRSQRDRSQSEWGRDPYRQTSRAGSSDHSDRSRHEDPHYDSWRQRHLSELDRDYDDYRRENQSRFEDDFAGWREKRQQKRGLLAQIREHMEVVGSDEKHVGTVDRVVTDRIILAKTDPESGGSHHSLSCSDVDRVEGERVILDCPADQARNRWRDESRSRALFEREDQGEMGPGVLDRSFSGTYR